MQSMLKVTAMKKLFLLIYAVTTLFIVSCSASKESRSENAEIREQNKQVNQLLVSNAIESRRFIIKLDRLYLFGGMIDLVPRRNYIIVDGEKAVISAAYLGRQYSSRPVAGLNMQGVATDYELTKKLSKGMYEIKMKVGNGANAFNIYMTVGRDGTTNASVDGMRINNARYRGYVVPINRRVPEDRQSPVDNEEVI
jgi:hypothetical protein